MKYVVTILIFFFQLNFSFAQSQKYHSVNFDFATPTLLQKYPEKSQIYKLTYQWKLQKTSFNVGFSIGPEYNAFRIPPSNPNIITDDRAEVRSWGGVINVFAGKNIFQNTNVSLFTEFGSYISKFVYSIEGDKFDSFPLKSALNSIGFGIQLNYQKQRFDFKLKLPFSRYEDGKSPFLKDSFGALYYNEDQGQSPVLVNGFNPSIGVGYIFKKKEK